MAGRYVFAYGSLMSPASLRSTLPDADLTACVPTVCRGFQRTFGVAFPNDGSQSDKAYFDEAGARPPFVLFADLVPADAVVNGVSIPVTTAQFESLRARELRYRCIELTDALDVGPAGSVVAFVGKPEFTRPSDIAQGVVPAGYLDLMQEGADYWDGLQPGFASLYQQTTLFPSRGRVRPLTRVNYPPA